MGVINNSKTSEDNPPAVDPAMVQTADKSVGLQATAHWPNSEP